MNVWLELCNYCGSLIYTDEPCRYCEWIELRAIEQEEIDRARAIANERKLARFNCEE